MVAQARLQGVEAIVEILARAISAWPVEGRVGQGARVKKTGCIDPGSPFTTESRTYAFWAKADSAEQRTVMLFGASSGEESGQFYFQLEGDTSYWLVADYVRDNVFKDVEELKPN